MRSTHSFRGHASLIADAGGRHLLVATYCGDLLLFGLSGDVPQMKSRGRPFGLGFDEEIYAHPAIVGNRLYLRATNSLVCVVF